MISDENDNCIDSCRDGSEYKYEYNGKCYKNCTNGFFIDKNNIAKCKCELNYCLSCSPVALYKNLCNEFNKNYYQIENDTSNLGEYIMCYKEPKGYYLDKNDSLYKKCYETCESCEEK